MRKRSLQLFKGWTEQRGKSMIKAIFRYIVLLMVASTIVLNGQHIVGPAVVLGILLSGIVIQLLFIKDKDKWVD